MYRCLFIHLFSFFVPNTTALQTNPLHLLCTFEYWRSLCTYTRSVLSNRSRRLLRGGEWCVCVWGGGHSSPVTRSIEITLYTHTVMLHFCSQKTLWLVEMFVYHKHAACRPRACRYRQNTITVFVETSLD